MAPQTEKAVAQAWTATRDGETTPLKEAFRVSLTAPVPAANDPQLGEAWRTCQLEEHLVELRSRHQLVSSFVDNLVPPTVRRVLRAYAADVEELLEHLEGLHADDCLVRAMQERL